LRSKWASRDGEGRLANSPRHAEKVLRDSLVAHDDPPKVLEPGKKSVYLPSPSVATQRSPEYYSREVIMTSFNPNYFIHAANVLLLVAYSVRDILWLRLFAVAASLISLPYFVLQPTPQWAPIAWSVVFAGINSFQAWRLYLERRPVKLTPDEEEVRRLAFAQLPSRKVLQLASLGSWTTAAPGERLIEHGTPAGAIALVVRGKVRVSKDGRVLGELGAGDIVGSALVLSGAPAEVDAVTVEPVRALRWEVATLRRYLEADPETRIVFQRNLTRDLAGELRRLREDYLQQLPSPGGQSRSAP
jgi:CRP-like cAMP-binding protein